MTRPRVTLKLATSLDGRIATASGESRWITGEDARAAGHRLRAEHDAILVGIETALADDPALTVRTPRYEGPQPVRIVLDSRARLPLESALVRTAREVPTVLVTLQDATPDHEAAGVVRLTVPALGERPDLTATLDRLAERGVRSILVEGGGQVAAGFLRCGLVDRVEWFRAPIVLGAEGRPGIGALALKALADAPTFRRVSVEALGRDLWERYEIA